MKWAKALRKEETGITGPMVRSMRRQADLSQLQLASLLGVTRMRIYLMERQGWVRPETFIRVHAALAEGERRGRQWLPKYRGYYESANDSEPPDYVTQRLIRARQKEAERQRRYRAKRKASALEVLAVVDGQIGALLFRQGRAYGQQAQEIASVIAMLRQIRKQQERIFRRGGYLRDPRP